MKAEILCVGTELLLGNIVNTNAAYIGRKLAEIGVDVHFESAVGDNDERLTAAINSALERADVLIITGGLGPTYDDVTKSVVARCFGIDEYEVFEPAAKKINEFRHLISKSAAQIVDSMAMIPKGSVPIPNDKGTAAGFRISKDGKHVVVMPGPPRECEYMMATYVQPFLADIAGSGVFESAFINMMGITESEVQMAMNGDMEKMTNPTVAPYIKLGEVTLRVTASGNSKEEAAAKITPVVEELKNKFSEFVYGVNAPNIETVAVQKLSEVGKKAAFAESCTGGLISKMVTDVPGASSVFDCGVCSYSNDIKHKVLGVKKETLDTFGAVSEETALEMAAGIRKVSGADFGISVTGIAGPDGGTDEKPVGLVYIGFASENENKAFKFNLRGDRAAIRELSAKNALRILLKNI